MALNKNNNSKPIKEKLKELWAEKEFRYGTIVVTVMLVFGILKITGVL